jgi:hypothetical protein
LFAIACASKGHDVAADDERDKPAKNDDDEGMSSNADDEEEEDSAAPRLEPTYHGGIRPLIEQNCLGCHVEGGIGPFPLDEWSAVRDVSPLVVAAVVSGIMPPWPADPDCRDLRDAPPMTEDDRELFMEWQREGFPEGDEDDYREPEPLDAIDPGEPTVVLSTTEPYTPPPLTDNYRCFPLVDGEFPEDGYLTGMDILPGARDQVHHVQIHRVSGADAAMVRELDAENEGAGYPCNAGTGVASQNMFSYRPGSRGVHFEEGDAAFIEAGSSLLIQVHYNTQFLPRGEEPEPDETKVALWTLAPGELPDRVVYRSGTIASLNIPAGEPNYVTQTQATMQSLSTFGGLLGIGGTYVPGEVVGMTPHAHHLASRLAATLTRADGSEECLIEVPDWDFHWQLDYMYKTILAFDPADMLTVTCEYDNSPENQAVVDGVKVMPRNVTWGEGSLDEMCLHYIWFRYDREAFLQARGN